MNPWKPRASALGGYVTCLWRAATDRAIYEGRARFEDVGEPQDQTGYAPHGTCIHYVTQTGIGCEFPSHQATDDECRQAAEHFGGDIAAAKAAYAAGDARAWAPLQSEWAVARTLFRGNVEAHSKAVATVSQVLASDLSKAADGKPWVAESAWETDYCTGHIDLLSQDCLEIGDIKTTAKPPDIASVTCKPGYLAQLAIYRRMVEQRTGIKPRRGFIHYIDSLRGQWTYRVPVDFTSPGMEFFAEQMESFCRFLMSDALWHVAYPNLGEHCDKTWCAYRPSCKRRIMPPPGRWYDRARAGRPTGVMQLPTRSVLVGSRTP